MSAPTQTDLGQTPTAAEEVDLARSPTLAEGVDLARSPTLGAEHAPDTQMLGGASGPAGEGLVRGDRLGRYVVVSRLGGGGMGAVYVAYDPDLDRKVALKILRPELRGRTGTSGRARLLREAKAMAQVSHPNVIAVYDVGTVGDDVFIAMELVEGQTLSQWLSGGRSPREIVSVFLQAGAGLAAAHRAGLVHRDFKPDNVLRGHDGRVRVLDFGLASAVRGDDPAVPAEATRPSSLEPLTQTGAIMGTPAYMAPEQFKGRQTDARSDQFSFCVALWEALCGTRPFGGKDYVSLALAVTTGQLSTPAEGRLPQRLRRLLERGLAVSAEARHPSLDALLAELGRDRAAALRRWAPAGIAALALVGGGAALVQRRAGLCGDAPDKLAVLWGAPQRRSAEAAFARVQVPYAKEAWKAAGALLDGYAADWVKVRTAACRATRVDGTQSDELMDLRMSCLDQRLAELGAVAAALSRADATTVENAARAAGGLTPVSTCSDAEALRSPVKAPGDAATRAKVAGVRAQLAQANALELVGRYTDGLAVADAATTAATALGHRPLEAEAHYQRGKLLDDVGRGKDAAQALEQAVLAAEAGHHDELAALSWGQLVGIVGYRLHRVDEGRRALAHAAALVERGAGGLVARAKMESNAGNLELATGRYEEAARRFRVAVEVREKAFGPAHPEVAAALSNLANALYKDRKLDDAITVHVRALALREQALGPQHPEVGESLSNLGSALRMQGKLAEAQAVLERAVALWEQALGPAHPNVATALGNLGGVLHAQGRSADALPRYRRALEIQTKALGPDHPIVADTYQSLGAVTLGLGRLDEALAHDERAVSLREKRLGPEHPDVAFALCNAADVEMTMGRWSSAIERLERALVVRKKALGPAHSLVGDTIGFLSAALLGAGRLDEARRVAEEGLALRRRTLGAEHLDVADSLNTLGNILAAGRRFAEARARHDEVVHLVEKAAGKDAPELCEPLAALGEDLLGLGRSRDAAVVLERALALRNGAPDAELAPTRFALARAIEDRARAVALARDARRGFEAAGKRAEVRRVEAWLGKAR